ncbi:uncharacterized protein BT62DRAFT_165727 [Guyanagaster necrorhizus]|uniref:Uncharacterized protein n=1 Tax=Guyanagaster necrorhizus TaxID=856835 RepID=A0A9P8ARZ3_9AGAR|nr:uncharacterized protein BT62DRAFT_165727 [Guyanagaster necrorhizus MCA 3950]KAG7445595.1 hypothetical protein BT62DRAFT_165727 [Guyanagaster necrorhizus MCA 3950]
MARFMFVSPVFGSFYLLIYLPRMWACINRDVTNWTETLGLHRSTADARRTAKDCPKGSRSFPSSINTVLTQQRSQCRRLKVEQLFGNYIAPELSLSTKIRGFDGQPVRQMFKARLKYVQLAVLTPDNFFQRIASIQIL